MKKLRNPYTQMEGYNCFGCSPNNMDGLRMEFVDEGEYMCCYWKPIKAFQGYKNVLHGGIQATMMDEIASWVVQAKLGTAGVTSQMQTRYLKPVFMTEPQITLRAKVHEIKRNIVVVDAGIYNTANELCAQSLVSYFTFNTELAREKYFYPGKESFYDEPNVNLG
ncbi:MAG: PaaI family thioesterase [Bacteroidota bacterium]